MIRIAMLGCILLAGGCASSPASPGEMSAAGVACRSNSMTFPAQRVAISFEDGSLCMKMAGAHAAKLLGKTLDARGVDHAGAVEWMNTQLNEGDAVIIDRFGRATVTRCSTDPALTSPAFRAEPKIGDGKRQMYLMIETPCEKAGAD